MPEQSDHKPEGEFVCSKCTIRFAEMAQTELKQGIDFLKANREKFCLFNFQAIDDKIKAVEMFLEDDNEQRKPIRYNQRVVDRKRTAGSIRHQERKPGLFEARAAAAFSQNRQHDTAISPEVNHELANGT